MIFSHVIDKLDCCEERNDLRPSHSGYPSLARWIRAGFSFGRDRFLKADVWYQLIVSMCTFMFFNWFKRWFQLLYEFIRVLIAQDTLVVYNLICTQIVFLHVLVLQLKHHFFWTVLVLVFSNMDPLLILFTFGGAYCGYSFRKNVSIGEFSLVIGTMMMNYTDRADGDRKHRMISVSWRTRWFALTIGISRVSICRDRSPFVFFIEDNTSFNAIIWFESGVFWHSHFGFVQNRGCTTVCLPKITPFPKQS